jgi:predicted restriction endonuclease
MIYAMAIPRIFGHVPGVSEGSTFASRIEAADAGVNRARQAGIVGSGTTGAESIVVSGGYEDDEDHGDLIVYTGHGGNDPATGRQIADQSLDSPGNAALLTSSLTGVPVRVVRSKHRSPHAPAAGYRYDGLFRVESSWTEQGRSGFRVCRYRLVKLTDEVPAAAEAASDDDAPAGILIPERRRSTAQRVVRSGAVAEHVKRLHDHTCQFCRLRISVRDNGYSEAAHIRPLGRPHNGPDVPENVLCLCPNCHVLFDYGVAFVDDDLQVTLPTGRIPLTVIRQRPTVPPGYPPGSTNAPQPACRPDRS